MDYTAGVEVEDHPDDTAAGLCCFSGLLRHQHNDPTIEAYNLYYSGHSRDTFQLIPFCHTSHCRSRPCREEVGGRCLLARGNVNASRRRRTCRNRLLKNWYGSLHPMHHPNFGEDRSFGLCTFTRLGKKRWLVS